MAFLTDTSTNNFQLTAFGNTTLNTTTFKYGNGSAYFDGNGDYIDAPLNSAFDFGSGDFTIEAWVHPTVAGSHTTIARWGVGGNAFFLAVDTTAGIVVYINDPSPAKITGGTIQTNQWQHIALTRQGTDIKAYINGNQAGSTFTIGTATINSTTHNLRIGADHLGNPLFTGYIDEIRITKGVARYTTTFTTPLTAFPDSNTTGIVGNVLQENSSHIIL